MRFSIAVFFISMKPASYNKPCWCVYWSTDPRTDIIQTSKQRTTQRNHEPPCLRVSILHHHHLATSIESLSSPLPPAPWPSPDLATAELSGDSCSQPAGRATAQPHLRGGAVTARAAQLSPRPREAPSSRTKI